MNQFNLFQKNKFSNIKWKNKIIQIQIMKKNPK